ncbi:unnamed protein product [Microthlaspi erraticum]|uniref:CCHC-type domain-containing protein n=1 Tax=Microthlaspi erraticum TaxID=1685480 RepID=A0A6D2JHP0_9BRAS|nr:unnamed protein product [Microthlaspi erraticum]
MWDLIDISTTGIRALKIRRALEKEQPVLIDDDEWTDMQEQAISTIRLCLLEDVMLQVEDLTTCKEIWEKLENLYMSKSLSSKLYLKQSLYGLKMSEGSDLMQHVHGFNQIVGDLARVCVKVEDEDKAMILLCSLPPSYETLLTALTCNKETISWETVAVSLQSHYERKQKTGAEGSHGDGLFANNQERGRQMNKQDGGGGARSKSKNRAKTICFGYGGKGHWRRDCLNKGKNKGKTAIMIVIQGIAICSLSCGHHAGHPDSHRLCFNRQRSRMRIWSLGRFLWFRREGFEGEERKNLVERR